MESGARKKLPRDGPRTTGYELRATVHFRVPFVRATAPIRICDNGGWTDTWFARHGRVFNLAVRPVVRVQIEVYPRGSRQARVMINAKNFGTCYAPDLAASAWGPHPLLEAAFREIPPPPGVDLEVTIASRAPAGASTGTSAAALVALLGALDRVAGGRRGAHEIAVAAHAVETVHLGQQSGIQDQLGSAYGGACFIEMTEYPHATVTRLPFAGTLRHELQRRLSVIFLGRAHSSSAVHEKVVKNLERRGPDAPELEALRVAAVRARDAFVAGDFAALGAAMRENTAAQAALHPDLVHADAWRAIEIAQAHGAAGWKVNGAGGDGGSITLLGSPQREARRAMLREIVEDNPRLTPIPIVISREGLRVEVQERVTAGSQPT
jgi:D-glycero-alpha-D-manno-heptose-7-phosphate kinase